MSTPGRNSFYLLIAAVLCLCAGCSTSFQYTSTHAQTFPPITNSRGLAIRTGQDLRPAAEIRPAWCEKVEPAIARSVREEVRHAKLFQRVKIHASDVNPKKFSEIVVFRVNKFECYDQMGNLESAGRDILRLRGIRGALIAASIPVRYSAEVSVEFEILDAATQQPVFTRAYSANRAATLNGYQSSDLKVAAVSAALESVITQFLSDLDRIPLSLEKR